MVCSKGWRGEKCQRCIPRSQALRTTAVSRSPNFPDESKRFCVASAHAARVDEQAPVVNAQRTRRGVMATLTMRPLIQRELSWRNRRFRVSLTTMIARR